ncbi:hypothetical protein GCK72_013248 [Caenorhabditis remanei]|uniref:F-box domain-containing protein n=1 Tax=Caenorhabditis remanei TaxID=31234 RepID=A0A6A5GQ91_CAERE|nr:hypothetical protein GCK72_013248 [Caenorhabditis remanei]KAF1756794.1 hypothetical protein GCK72_013248 [Caenorhabditis remanei]
MRSVHERLAATIAKRKNDRQNFEFWSALPEELRKKCIGTMELQARCRLRATSKTNKKLVESLELDVETLVLDGEKSVIKLKYRDGDGVLRCIFCVSNSSGFESGIYLIGWLMKSATIKHMQIMRFRSTSITEVEKQIINKMVPHKSSRISALHISDFNDIIFFFLEKMWTKMDRMKIWVRGGSDYSFDQLMKIPSFDYVKLFETSNFLSNYKNPCAVNAYFPIIQTWVENNAPVGKKLMALDVRRNGFSSFVKRFKSLLISQGHSEVVKAPVARIGTNNPSKHILGSLIEGNDKYKLICVIIPACLSPDLYHKYINSLH